MATVFTRNPSPSSMVLSGGGTIVTASSGPTNAYVVATPAYLVGKRYVEFEMLNADASAYSAVGLSTDVDSTTWLGGDAKGVGLWGDSRLYYNNQSAPLPGAAIATGDVIQFAVDLDQRLFWVGVNNTWYGSPSTGVGGMVTMPLGALGPAACPYNTSRSIKLKASAADCTFSPPAGFVHWGTSFRFDGTVRDASNAPFAAVVRAHDRATGTLYAYTTSDAVTGEFTLYLPTGGDFDMQVMYPTNEHNDKFYARCSPYAE